jgi:hypothetical protein
VGVVGKLQLHPDFGCRRPSINSSTGRFAVPPLLPCLSTWVYRHNFTISDDLCVELADWLGASLLTEDHRFLNADIPGPHPDADHKPKTSSGQPLGAGTQSARWLNVGGRIGGRMFGPYGLQCTADG